MSYTTRATFSGSLQGSTEGGCIGCVSWQRHYDDQDAHYQVIVSVEDGDVLKMVNLADAPQAAGQSQTLFVMKTTGDVQVRLNETDALIFNLTAGGILAFSGLPNVDKLEFSSLVAEEVKVSINKVFGTSSVIDPSPGGGGTALEWVLDPFTATAGQTEFTLSRAPGLGAVLLFIEGVQYSSPTFFTISGSTLTWLDLPFTLPAAARVEVFYK